MNVPDSQNFFFLIQTFYKNPVKICIVVTYIVNSNY